MSVFNFALIGYSIIWKHCVFVCIALSLMSAEVNNGERHLIGAVNHYDNVL